MKIRDNETEEVFEYGENQHHALKISEDGKCLYFENLQNGEGSLEGGYSFVLEDGYTPKESLSPEAMNDMSYANIGGFKNTDNNDWIQEEEIQLQQNTEIGKEFLAAVEKKHRRDGFDRKRSD